MRRLSVTVLVQCAMMPVHVPLVPPCLDAASRPWLLRARDVDGYLCASFMPSRARDSYIVMVRDGKLCRAMPRCGAGCDVGSRR